MKTITHRCILILLAYCCLECRPKDVFESTPPVYDRNAGAKKRDMSPCFYADFSWNEVTCNSCGTNCSECNATIHSGSTQVCFYPDGGSIGGSLTFSNGSGGGGGGGGAGSAYTGPNDALAVLTNYTEFDSPGTTKRVRNAIEFFNQRCTNKYLYQSMARRNIKIQFSIDGAAPSPAYYQPGQNAIRFRNNNDILERDFFQEEMFHAFQDHFYAGGTSQFIQNGRSNIEFEAKLYRDILIIKSGNAPCCVTVTDDKSNEYFFWLNDITANGTIFPKTYDDFKGKYFYYMDSFKQKYPEYNQPSVPSLLPNAMLDAFNNSNCK